MLMLSVLTEAAASAGIGQPQILVFLLAEAIDEPSGSAKAA